MERSAVCNGGIIHLSSLFLLTGLIVVIFLFPRTAHSQDLKLYLRAPAKEAQSFQVSSSYKDSLTISSDLELNNNNYFSNSYVIKLRYQINKGIYFLVGRGIKHTVDPQLYAPPGSHEFNPALTLNRAPALGQFGFIIQY
ncbi:hypothetical protein [Emcibacter sp.]|uniref:hypothetical protein n=1 Tax=Emcibacter sp. TaxID=1979954 RepID=UPI003A8DA7B0